MKEKSGKKEKKKKGDYLLSQLHGVVIIENNYFIRVIL